MERTIFVSIYCKLYTDQFSTEMINRYASGQQIYAFLMKEAGLAYDPDCGPLPGDCNLWYLGCCEKFGYMVLGERAWQWGFGESSFDNVEAFVRELRIQRLITQEQHQALKDKIVEGRQINNMYQIWEYLDAKLHDQPWRKKDNCYEFRSHIKRMVAQVSGSLEHQGYKVIT